MSKKFDIFDILVGKPEDPDYRNKPVIIQGITGNFGSVHTRLMREYGTNIVAGVTPNKGGQSFEGIPVFDSVEDASKSFNVQISGIFVPAPFFLSAISKLPCLCTGSRVTIFTTLTSGHGSKVPFILYLVLL